MHHARRMRTGMTKSATECDVKRSTADVSTTFEGHEKRARALTLNGRPNSDGH